MIELTNIRKVFNSGKPNEFVALHGVSLSIEPQRTTTLKGPSGSGKTTLLGILGCMARPTAGRITLEDREITSLPERFLTEIRRRTFGFIFQQHNLIKGITTLENVMLPAYPYGERHSDLKSKGAGAARALQPVVQGPGEDRVAFRGRGPAGGHRAGADQRSGDRHRR